MTSVDYHQRDIIPVAYPPPLTTAATTKEEGFDGAVTPPPPPVGYPRRDGDGQDERGHSTTTTTKARGEGFWKGCVAALCCCWILDFCCF